MSGGQMGCRVLGQRPPGSGPSNLLPAAGSKGGYVPPSIRNRMAGGDGESMRRREENSVRVTNLSEDTREDDLRVRPSFRVKSQSTAALRVQRVCIGSLVLSWTPHLRVLRSSPPPYPHSN